MTGHVLHVSSMLLIIYDITFNQIAMNYQMHEDAYTGSVTDVIWYCIYMKLMLIWA